MSVATKEYPILVALFITASTILLFICVGVSPPSINADAIVMSVPPTTSDPLNATNKPMLNVPSGFPIILSIPVTNDIL